MQVFKDYFCNIIFYLKSVEKQWFWNILLNKNLQKIVENKT